MTEFSPTPDSRAARSFYDRSEPPEGGRTALAHGPGRGLRSAVLEPVRRLRDELLGGLATVRLLELGCGYGDDLLRLAERGARAVGVDFAFERLRRVPQRARGDYVVACADCHRLPFPAATFGIVFGEAVLAHLDRRRALAETRRVLVDGGRLLLIEPLNRHPLLRLYRRLAMRRGEVVSYLDWNELDADHLGGGYHLLPVGLCSVLLLPPAALGLDGRFWHGLARLLSRFDAWLFRRSAWARRHAWIALAHYRRSPR
ncbi:MAG: methyltransferase domain-containing protein [Candidatus Coatesbacteria bacterium]|nr:methyltransferase domain-containing protein [Candidatus Coatesbacteria bacterium]